jgi:prepilin-type N-terminal cleavage/methylation domain-containing protein
MMSIPRHFERFTLARASHHDVTRVNEPPAGFTLIELLVTIVIISILSSLTLAGLAVARQRVKADRTETTIRKIHEAVMPHYEQFASRTLPKPTFTHPNPTLATLGTKGVSLIAKRRMMALELPDGWNDLLQNNPNDSLWSASTYQSGVSRRFHSIVTQNVTVAAVQEKWGDAECLWLSVMQGGYANPSIISHFREDEFGDRDGDNQREFIDGWGNPIRFLRWAPKFVSRYQPALAAGTAAHDAFDLAGVDPLARATLFPLIYSMGPDGEPDIECRDQPALTQFSYPQVGYDPYFATRPAAQHLTFSIRGVAEPAVLGRYWNRPENATVLGAGVVTDDVHNHSMSR